MPVLVALFVLLASGGLREAPAGGAQQSGVDRNVWESQYRNRSAADMAAQFESESRPVYRHRHDIIRLLDLAPGMSVAEIGAGSGFLSRLAAHEVGAGGHVVATELDPKMVAYIAERAAREELPNVTAVQGRVDATGLEPTSADAIMVVNTYSFFDRPAEMMRSIAAAMKPGGLLLIVDFHRADGPSVQVIVATAAAAGVELIDRSDAVSGHFAVRFRKK